MLFYIYINLGVSLRKWQAQCRALRFNLFVRTSQIGFSLQSLTQTEIQTRLKFK